MVIACPQCGRKLQAEESAQDRQVRCPGCQNTFVIPARVAGAVPVAEEVLPPAAPVPVAAAPRSAAQFTRKPGFAVWAKPLLVAGLLLVVVSRGCDSLSSRGVVSAHAKMTQAQNDFEARWDRDLRKMTTERKGYEEQLNKVTDKPLSDEQKGNLEKKVNELTEKLKKVQDDKEKEAARLRDGAWADMANDARNAGASYETQAYWFGVGFLAGTVALVLGLLALAFSATTTVERILSLGMIAIIVFSIYVAGMAWFTSVAADAKGLGGGPPMARSALPLP
jgi:hypothetical protein